MTTDIHILFADIQDYKTTLFGLVQEIAADWTTVEAALSSLQDGGWKGKGADEFYEEMVAVRKQFDEVLRRCNRRIQQLDMIEEEFQEVDGRLARRWIAG